MQTVPFSDAAFKIIDEALSNAADQAMRNPVNNQIWGPIPCSYPQSAEKTTRIDVTVADTYEISIMNDGPGMPIHLVEMHPDPNDKDLIITRDVREIADLTPANARPPNWTYYWNPTILTSVPFSSTNYENTGIKAVSGCYGVGMKMLNFMSAFFKIETADSTRYFSQEFYDSAKRANEPVVRPRTEKQFTRVTFLPKYAEELGITRPEHLASLKSMIYTRCYMIASYLGISVYFNGMLIPCKTLQNFCDYFIFPINTDFTAVQPAQRAMLGWYGTIEPSGNFPWQIYVMCSNTNVGFSIVNGSYIYESSTHIEPIQAQIVEYAMNNIKGRLDKVGLTTKVMTNLVKTTIHVFMAGAIDSPSFNSNAKSKVSAGLDKFAAYRLTPAQLSAIWRSVEDTVECILLDKLDEKEKTVKKKGRIVDANATDAKFAGIKGKQQNCWLFILEGDTALPLVTKQLSDDEIIYRPDGYTWTTDWNGVCTTQGIVMNVRTSTRIILDRRTGKMRKVRSDQLRENKRFQMIEALLGLSHTFTYEIGTERGDLECATLRYGKVVITTDQDHDGAGAISSLLLNYFEFFWPDLIKRGFIIRINTPVIRASSGDDEREFQTTSAFEAWLSTDEARARKWSIDYTKGLGKTSVEQRRRIFKYFTLNMNVFTLSKECPDWFKTYFDSDATPRKIELRYPSHEECETGVITCTRHLRTYGKAFQRYSAVRGLPCVYNGLSLSQMKVIAVARKIWAAKDMKSVSKIDSIVSDVKKYMHYQHGEASLQKTILGLGCESTDTNLMPLLLGDSLNEGFYDRNTGKLGAARYMEVILNKPLTDALFPKVDDGLLEYNYLEGEECEPILVPIFPLALCENNQTPTHGWLCSMWARSFTQLMECVLMLIKGGNPVDLPVLRFESFGWKGKYDIVNGIQYMKGTYYYDEKADTCIITELPIGVRTTDYLYANPKREKELFDKYKARVIRMRDAAIAAFHAGKQTVHDQKRALYDFAYSGTNVIAPPAPKSKSRTKADDSEDAPDLKGLYDVPTGCNFYPPEYESRYVVNKSLVKGKPHNTSNNKNIRLEVQFVKGAKAKLDTYHIEALDGVTKYLNLYEIMHDHINMIGHKEMILEYTDYRQPLVVWFNERKRLYILRVDQRIGVCKARIIVNELRQKFLELSDKMGLANATEEYRLEMLKTNKFPPVNMQVILNPRKRSAEEILRDLHTVDATYDYVLDLNYKASSERAIKMRAKETEEYREELARLTRPDPYFPGAMEWINELAILQEAVTKGRTLGWSYWLKRSKKYT